MNNKVKEENLWCEYSDMPSPMAYAKCTDYDSMGNHGRFPVIKKRKVITMRRHIQKLLLWVSFKFPKKKRKTIWEL